MSSVVPQVTVESAMPAEMVSLITLAPMMAETATLPEAATLRATELMEEESMADRSTRPPALTVELLSMVALIAVGDHVAEAAGLDRDRPGGAHTHADGNNAGIGQGCDIDIARVFVTAPARRPGLDRRTGNARHRWCS